MEDAYGIEELVNDTDLEFITSEYILIVYDIGNLRLIKLS